MLRYLSVSLLAFIVFAAPAFAKTYDLDPAHTTIGFSARHMVISNVAGKFEKFSGSFDLDDKGALTKASASMEVASINTGVEKRDKHLKSPDFFDAGKFSKITFVSKKITHKGNDYTVIGDMTIKNITKSVTLTGELMGTAVGFGGEHRAGFHAEGKINRKDFGVNFNAMLETGGLVVSDEVKIILDIEGIMKK
ncbi:Protein yceI precursor [hydrothermal vent metagenome]|uniref:Protein yceI n=1 Tax=hydrothermal vent metagenome TaxID=652676 RepID=A0A3B1BT55_9ZZZZ